MGEAAGPCQLAPLTDSDWPLERPLSVATAIGPTRRKGPPGPGHRTAD